MKTYPSDSTDRQWKIIEKILNEHRKRKYSLRMIWNGIFYLLKTSCQWRMLPDSFPPWKSVYYHHNKWKHKGLIEKIHEALRKQVRQKANREVSPSAGCMDSQSVKTGRKGGIRGIDGGKKVKGGKRHVVVDTLGLLLAVVVHAANEHDSKAARNVLSTLKGKINRLKTIFADGGYRGELIEWAQAAFGWVICIALPNQQANGFEVLPKRWVVERTFSWFESYRRLSRDYEYRTDTSETMIQVAMIRLMVNRL